MMLTLGIAGSGPASQTNKEVKIPLCKGNAALVGECFTVHGRMRFYNGTHNVRIWPIGTHRLIGVEYVPGSIDNPTEEHPDGVYWMPVELSNTSTFGVEIYGDFEVCPLSKKRPGAMQVVCVESAKHLVVKDYNKEPNRVYRIHDATNH
ncbi:MAG: hypothetical protein ACRD4A_04510 [Candidatus Acidiferrales bacterium]